MNDPWDVKSVRQAGQYVSCMKLNGVPLLPPILSKECRKEMQYYKLLAKEVEKRITLLQPYILDSDTESDNMTDAPELPECEQNFKHPQDDAPDGYNLDIDKITTAPKNKEKYLVDTQRCSPIKDLCNNVVLESVDGPPSSPKFIIDFSLRINETTKNDIGQKSQYSTPQMDLPERDYNCTRRITQKVITEKEVITEVETQRYSKQKETEAVAKFSCNISNKQADHLPHIPVLPEGPSSLSSKSFTGSLNDLHSESTKDLLTQPLTRQRSYTILNPSPQLLAHLEVQALNTGLEMTAISMSESLSNISVPNNNKKRRSWDLESAKVKWSTMAMELNQTKSINKNIKQPISKKASPPAQTKASPPVQSKAKSVTPPERARRNIATPKSTVRSEPLPKTNTTPKPEVLLRHRKSSSPVRNGRSPTKDTPSPSPIVQQQNRVDSKSEPKQAVTLVSESDDPATRVRELYEKIQNQQLLQMASLVEKQKKEQMLLQQVFEEQNNLLFKQLKTICPKSPIEAKEAWGEKHSDGDRGPVSLSQLINFKSPESSPYESPVSATLTDTTTYISHCDNVLKKSRDITGSIKKQPVKAITQNASKPVTPKTQGEVCRAKKQSPIKSTPTSRRLNYDTSASSERDYDQMLTDRTNDTLADLNVTFPSDNSEDGSLYSDQSIIRNEIKSIHGESYRSSQADSRKTDNAIKSLERSIQNSINSTTARVSKCSIKTQAPTPSERAAASKIVAYAKGYLVRRLMRTERVQTTVQTIKDALLCALQLHQDREGIRGADVDLHRRLIQQITAACYSLHDTFVASTATERCAMIAADRGRRLSLAARQATSTLKQTESQMSQSHCGSFPARPAQRPPVPASIMSQSNYDTFSCDGKSDDKRSTVSVSRYNSPHRRPWR